MGDDTQDGTEREGLDIAAIAARVEAATPGPWHSTDHGWTVWASSEPHADSRFIAAATAPTTHEQHDRGKADARFIAHARQDIPALLAALGRAERRLADMTTQRDGLLMAADIFNAEWADDKAALGRAEAVVEAARAYRTVTKYGRMSAELADALDRALDAL